MDQTIWLGYGLQVAVCWVLGLGALRAALRRNELIDWGLAAVVILAGAIGCPLTFLPSIVSLPPELRARVLAAGIAGLGAASTSLYVVTWRFFRPRSVAAALLCSAGTFAIAWSFLAELLTAGFSWGRDRFWLTLGGTACGIPYLWGAVEMLRHGGRERRRARSPAEVEQARAFTLYGLALGAVAVVYVPGLRSAFLSHGRGHPRGIVAFVAAAGLVALVSAALAFRHRARGLGEPGS